jgi:hypothetical protein
MNTVTRRNDDGTFDVVQRAAVGGLFARHPYGAIAWSAREDEAIVALEEFAPRLRGWFFQAERRFHEVVGRRFLQRVARACA